MRQGFAAVESGLELISIHQHLRENASAEFRRRLRDYVKGTILEMDEKPSTGSNHARNIGFELFLGARMAEARFNPVFPEDGDLHLPSFPMNFECKRLQSEKMVATEVADAADQLHRRAKGADPTPVGIIALNVGKLIHGGARVLQAASTEELDLLMHNQIKEFRLKHYPKWSKSKYTNVHGAFVFFSGPVVTPEPATLFLGHYTGAHLSESKCDKVQDASIRLLVTEMSKYIGPQTL
jgi:hypothetical protein